MRSLLPGMKSIEKFVIFVTIMIMRRIRSSAVFLRLRSENGSQKGNAAQFRSRIELRPLSPFDISTFRAGSLSASLARFLQLLLAILLVALDVGFGDGLFQVFDRQLVFPGLQEDLPQVAMPEMRQHLGTVFGRSGGRGL